MKYMVYATLMAELLLSNVSILFAKNAVAVQDHYKKVADGLVSIRKEYPSSQPKIYAMLDQLDKLYNTAKSICHKKKDLKQKLSEKSNEVGVLKQEIASLKKETSSAHKTLESTKTVLAQKLAEEQIRTQQLQQEHIALSEKIALLEAQKQEHALAHLARKDKKDILTKETARIINQQKPVQHNARQL